MSASPRLDDVWLSLGSNLPGAAGGPERMLEWAVTRLSDAGLAVVKRSRWWRSAAWPNAADPTFLNGAALVETDLTPSEALGELHRIEAEAGRKRLRLNAPRPLDLDLIAWGGRVEAGPPILPHPRAAERLFVMGPLAEIAPGWRHPVSGRTARALAATAGVGRDAQPDSPVCIAK